METFMQQFPSSDKINTLYKTDTELCSDSVEWCPHKPHQNVFVCACYQLEEEKSSEAVHFERCRKRTGRVLLYSITPDGGLKLHQQLETAAVLDQKWCHIQIDGSSVLALVNAEKVIEVYNLDVSSDGNINLKLVTFLTLIKCEKEVLILSLDWSTGIYEYFTPEIVCSDSKGNIHKLRFQNGNLTLLDTWHAHEYEAWISAFYYWNINIVFTGGDDSLFLKFDTRVGNQPVTVNRSHKAGVTSIHSNIKQEFLIATGSYDSTLRLWDTRYMKTSKNELEMPGTLWKLKWDPFNCDHLLIACMLGGVHIVKANMDNSEIVESYYDHKNLAYGVDWCYLNENELKRFEYEGNRIVASCSFYDHLLCVSKLYCVTNV